MRQPQRVLLITPLPLLGGCTLGPTELAIILAIVVLLFGATRLPALARAMGESMRHFKKAASEEDDAELPSGKDVKRIEKARVESDQDD